MTPFFRKIRKALADDNKPIKYLRYAIGEIILVVIGIHIALGINNWHLDSESKYYKQFQGDLVFIVTMSEREKQHFDNILKEMQATYN